MATPVDDAVGVTGDARIDGLTHGSRWDSGGGTTVVTYSFSINDNPQGGPWTQPLRKLVLDALTAWSNVANISFVERDSGGVYSESTADMAFIPIGNELDEPGFQLLGLGIMPSPGLADGLLSLNEITREDYPHPEGDVAFSNGNPIFENTAPGGAAFWVALHEIGHALGLKHPDDSEGVGSSRLTFDQLGMEGRDSSSYTVMTTGGYSEPGSTSNPMTPMLLDIVAIQHIYGANTRYHTGDDVYDVGIPAPFNPAYTIWDAGGVDTVRGYITYIDLRPGSTMMGLTGPRYGIAYGTLIENFENAVTEPYNVTVVGNEADNTFSGLRPIDTAEGGRGNDRYFLTADRSTLSTTIHERPSEGFDMVFSPVDYTLPLHVETLTLTAGARGVGNGDSNRIVGSPGADTLEGGWGNDTLEGGDSADRLVGGEGHDTLLAGGGGADTLVGGAGDDFYEIRSTATVIVETGETGRDTVYSYAASFTLTDYVEDLHLTDPVNDANGTGNGTANFIRGNVGSNRLEGRGGDDRIVGGPGNDTLDGGSDDDTLEGGEGDDVLIAGSALTIDVLVGGLGDDVFDVAHTEVRIEEAPAQGHDTVRAHLSQTALADNVEDLVLVEGVSGTGNVLANVLTGNAGSNVLAGLGDDDALLGDAGHDTLDGGDGADTLNGGEGDDVLRAGSGSWIDVLAGALGNDVYEVYNPAFVGTENPGEGVDTLRSYAWVTTLPGNIEHLALVDPVSDVSGNGNALANFIAGNAGNNLLAGLEGADTLNGGAGNDVLLAGSGLWTDRLLGGAGDDVYEIYNAASVLVEGAGGGYDTLRSYAWSTTLRNNLERLELVDPASDVDGIGNGLDNVIVGNAGSNELAGIGGNDTLIGGAGNDTLTGGAGVDSLVGGAGNDLYVAETSDVVTEGAGGSGIDTVRSATSYTLGAAIENLVLTGAAVNGVGNTAANAITGNKLANVISGLWGDDTLRSGAGDDTLNGGASVDQLIGGAGNDRFVFIAGQANGDRIADFAGNGALAGDELLFRGYGGGATFTQSSPIAWQISYANGTETLWFARGTTIDASDYTFM